MLINYICIQRLSRQIPIDGGGVTIADDPLKRTFLIYRTGQDSFDMVFTSDSALRTSVSMNRT